MKLFNYKIDLKITLIFIVLLFLVAATVLPLYLMFATSLKSEGTILTTLNEVIPDDMTLQNYKDVFKSGPFPRYIFNSFFVAISVTLGNMIFCSLAGYVFARKEFKIKKLLFIVIMGTMMIPSQVTIVPLFLIMKQLNWFNTYYALIIPGLAGPFGILLMTQYFKQIPRTLDESAFIDGASDLYVLTKILMPLAKPALVVLGVLTFLGSWNDFLLPLLLTDTVDMRTLPVGLALYKGLNGVDWVHLMAGSSLAAIPVIIIFLIFQRQIISGLLKGALKG